MPESVTVHHVSGSQLSPLPNSCRRKSWTYRGIPGRYPIVRHSARGLLLEHGSLTACVEASGRRYRHFRVRKSGSIWWCSVFWTFLVALPRRLHRACLTPRQRWRSRSGNQTGAWRPDERQSTAFRPVTPGGGRMVIHRWATGPSSTGPRLRLRRCDNAAEAIREANAANEDSDVGIVVSESASIVAAEL